jgi:hypothetical protein
MSDQLLSQVIEQFRMSGALTEGTEVAGGGNESFIEVVLPDTVDCDSAYQWVRAVGDLSCVRKSTPYGRLVFGLCQRQIG